jgi:nucleotide-binding universal stress UspA family protein
VIGVGMRGYSVGAVCFGRWIQKRPGGEHDEFEVVHAVSDATNLQLAQRAIEETLSDNGLLGPHVAAHVQDLGDPVAALADSCAAIDANAVIVGRRASLASGGWPRLGRNGRRLLRAHPGPVVVVPPDWTPAVVGHGPILIASDLSWDSQEALHFGVRVAEALQRAWMLVHVVRPPAAFTMYGLGSQPEEAEARQAEAQRHALEGAKALGGSEPNVRIAQGEVVDAILEVRDELDAPLIITGSRRLSVLGRLFSASVGTELAGLAPCPVAVVPPDEHHLEPPT